MLQSVFPVYIYMWYIIVTYKYEPHHQDNRYKHESMQLYQMEPLSITSTSYIKAWVFQQRTRSWTPSEKIILPCGHSSRLTKSPSFYQIQYPQHWVNKIEHRKTHSLVKDQHAKHRKLSTSTSTQQSTIQRFPQGRYTSTKPDDFPSNQAVGTNIWWSYMHMNQMLFLSNYFLIDTRNQSCKRIKK